MTGSSASSASSASSVFPTKLHRLLNEASKDDRIAGYEDVISWSPDGKSFKVHDKVRFSNEIMPTHFGSAKYRSFQKNLNMWGFKAARKGGCSHPLFIRESEALMHKMKRQLVNRQKQLRSDQEQQQQQVTEMVESDSAVLSKQTSSPFHDGVVAKKQAETPRRSSLATIEVLRRRASYTGSGRSSAGEQFTRRNSLALPSPVAVASQQRSTGEALLSELLLQGRALPSLSGVFSPLPTTPASSYHRRDSIPQQVNTRRLSGSTSNNLEADVMALRVLLLEEEQRSREQDNLTQQLRNRMNGLVLLTELQHLSDAAGRTYL
jgi:hypothetical protein